jgi:hypothetical protein
VGVWGCGGVGVEGCGGVGVWGCGGVGVWGCGGVGVWGCRGVGVWGCGGVGVWGCGGVGVWGCGGVGVCVVAEEAATAAACLVSFCFSIDLHAVAAAAPRRGSTLTVLTGPYLISKMISSRS